MYWLIPGQNTSKKNKAIKWDGECEETFGKLKGICPSTPILAYAEFFKPFTLHTDGYTLWLGAVLYQNQDGVNWVIGYTSRVLNKTECMYPAHRLEFLALKRVILELFNKYLNGNTLVLYADNNLLTYFLTSAKWDATGHHWVASLVNYNFALSYQSGKMNVDADALSHISREEHDQHVEADTVCTLISQAVQGTILTEAYSCDMQATVT